MRHYTRIKVVALRLQVNVDSMLDQKNVKRKPFRCHDTKWNLKTEEMPSVCNGFVKDMKIYTLIDDMNYLSL